MMNDEQWLDYHIMIDGIWASPGISLWITDLLLAIWFVRRIWFVIIVSSQFRAHMLTGLLCAIVHYGPFVWVIVLILFKSIVVFVLLLLSLLEIKVVACHFSHLEYDLALLLELQKVLGQALHQRLARRGGWGRVLVLRLFYFLADKDYWWSLGHRWWGVGTAYLLYAFVLRSRLLMLLANRLLLFPFFDDLLIISLADRTLILFIHDLLFGRLGHLIISIRLNISIIFRHHSCCWLPDGPHLPLLLLILDLIKLVPVELDLLAELAQLDGFSLHVWLHLVYLALDRFDAPESVIV